MVAYSQGLGGESSRGAEAAGIIIQIAAHRRLLLSESEISQSNWMEISVALGETRQCL